MLKGPRLLFQPRFSFRVSFSLSSPRPTSSGTSYARASCAYLLGVEYEEYTHEGESYVHTRTRVTSCPRSNVSLPLPARSTEHPSVSPWSIRPTALLHPFFPFTLLTPTTPGFSSEVHRSSPITRTCHLASRSPWKPPKAPDISLVWFFSPSGSFHLYSRLSLLGSLGTRAIKLLRAKTPSPSSLTIFHRN